MELLIFWVLCSILGAAMLGRYNKAGTGFLLGAILGPFGLLFALLIRSNENKKEDQRSHDQQMKAIEALTAGHEDRSERECPYCAEKILAKARVCKHCGRDVQPLEA
jgi:hypothetical protein